MNGRRYGTTAQQKGQAGWDIRSDGQYSGLPSLAEIVRYTAPKFPPKLVARGHLSASIPN